MLNLTGGADISTVDTIYDFSNRGQLCLLFLQEKSGNITSAVFRYFKQIYFFKNACLIIYMATFPFAKQLLQTILERLRFLTAKQQ